MDKDGEEVNTKEKEKEKRGKRNQCFSPPPRHGQRSSSSCSSAGLRGREDEQMLLEASAAADSRTGIVDAQKPACRANVQLLLSDLTKESCAVLERGRRIV